MKKKQRLPNIASDKSQVNHLQKVIAFEHSENKRLSDEVGILKDEVGTLKDEILLVYRDWRQAFEALQECAEVLNLLASRAGICTEDAAPKSDAEDDFGALAALRAAREVFNHFN